MHFDDVPVAGLNGHKGDIKGQHKEYMSRLPENKEALALGSRLNPATGQTDPRNAKDAASRLQQFGRVNAQYVNGYNKIQWEV